MIVGIFEILIFRDFFGGSAAQSLKNGIFWDFGYRKIGKNQNIKISHDHFLRIPTRIMYAIFQRLDPIFLWKIGIFQAQKMPYNL